MTEEEAAMAIDALKARAAEATKSMLTECLAHVKAGDTATPIALACAHFAMLSLVTDTLPDELHGLIEGIGKEIVEAIKVDMRASSGAPTP